MRGDSGVDPTACHRRRGGARTSARRGGRTIGMSRSRTSPTSGPSGVSMAWPRPCDDVVDSTPMPVDAPRGARDRAHGAARRRGRRRRSRCARARRGPTCRRARRPASRRAAARRLQALARVTAGRPADRSRRGRCPRRRFRPASASLGDHVLLGRRTSVRCRRRDATSRRTRGRTVARRALRSSSPLACQPGGARTARRARSRSCPVPAPAIAWSRATTSLSSGATVRARRRPGPSPAANSSRASGDWRLSHVLAQCSTVWWRARVSAT